MNSSVLYLAMAAAILVLLLSFPNTALAFHSFKTLPLPSLGFEALAFDLDNNGPYTGLSDGRVVRATGHGFEEFATTVPNRPNELCDGTGGSAATAKRCGRPLDLEFNDKTGELYIVDLYQGLMVVGPDGGVATPVAESCGDGMPDNAPDAIAIDPVTKDVYFTDVGAIMFSNNNMTEILISGDTNGRLLKYEPKTKKRMVVLTGLAGASGAAVSEDGSFILIAEYMACKITRLWLKGPKANTVETFAQLPGNPDNIKRTKTGDFWVAVNIQKLYPELTCFPLGQKLNPMGQITETVNFYAEYNTTYITEVHEHHDSLYVASVYADAVGVYQELKCVTPSAQVCLASDTVSI